MKLCLVISLLFVSLLVSVYEVECVSEPSSAGGKTNVFIVAHSHVDEGWRESLESYQNSVDEILSNTIKCLQESKDRKFIWSETSFLQNWYERFKHLQVPNLPSNITYGEALHNLIHKTKQWEFVGGGWVQHDEALPLYESMLLQMTEGHLYLKQVFGIEPSIALQNDVFGHSSVTPLLFEQMGFKAIILNRIHTHLKHKLREERKLEFFWPYKSNRKSNLLAHILYKHYNPPKQFDFEYRYGKLSLQDLDNLASQFIEYINTMAEHYATNNILFIWGDDFKFKYANNQFNSMDQLISFMNNKYGNTYNIKYSTLSDYVNEVLLSRKQIENIELPFLKDRSDFFPYIDSYPFDYWTGYYSLRPMIKRFIREEEANLKGAETLFSFTFIKGANMINKDKYFDEMIEDIKIKIQTVRRHLSILQHHDAITGTHSHAAHISYRTMLQYAKIFSTSIMEQCISYLLRNQKSPLKHLKNEIKFYDTEKRFTDPPKDVLSFDNEEDIVPLIVYNPLSWERIEYVEIIIKNLESDVLVTNDVGDTIEAQLVPYIFSTQIIENIKPPMFNRLIFKAKIEGFSISTFFLKQVSDLPKSTHVSKMQFFTNDFAYLSLISPEHMDSRWDIKAKKYPLHISNNLVEVLFDKHTGSLMSMSKKAQSLVTTFKLTQEFLSYRSLWNSFWFTTGPYLFRVNWGIWMLCGIVTGYSVSFIASFFVDIFIYLTHRRIFMEKKFLKNDKLFSMITLLCAPLLALSLFHFLHVIISNNSYDKFNSSASSFGLPIGLGIGLLISITGNIRTFFSFGLLFVFSYLIVMFGNHHKIARNTLEVSDRVFLMKFEGPLVQELVQVTRIYDEEQKENMAQISTVYHDKPYLEIMNSVFAFPNQDLVSRFTLHNMPYSNHFYTDANDLWLVKRSFRSLIPTQGNFYPVTSSAHLRDTQKDVYFDVLTSHSIGVTSFDGNSLEFMIHRHTILDDERGLEYPVSESERSDYKFRLFTGHGHHEEGGLSKDNGERQKLTEEFRNPFIIFRGYPSKVKNTKQTGTYADDGKIWKSNFLTNFNAMKASFLDYLSKQNTRVLTLQVLVPATIEAMKKSQNEEDQSGRMNRRDAKHVNSKDLDDILIRTISTGGKYLGRIKLEHCQDIFTFECGFIRTNQDIHLTLMKKKEVQEAQQTQNESHRDESEVKIDTYMFQLEKGQQGSTGTTM